jgi:hypothetical protein
MTTPTNHNTRRCSRAGCPRRIPEHGAYPTCGPICGLLDRMTQESERITQCIGRTPVGDQLAESITELAAAFDKASQIRKDIWLQARAAGITSSEWSRITRGISR